MFAHLNPHSPDFGDICAFYSPFLHQLTMQTSLFEPGRLRPCPSYSRRRDRINFGLLRGLYKGGGYLSGLMPAPLRQRAPRRSKKSHLDKCAPPPFSCPPPLCSSPGRGGGGPSPGQHKYFCCGSLCCCVGDCVVRHCHLYPLYSWQDILLTLELDSTTMFPPGTNVMFIRSIGKPVLAQVVGHSEHGDAYCRIYYECEGKML